MQTFTSDGVCAVTCRLCDETALEFAFSGLFLWGISVPEHGAVKYTVSFYKFQTFPRNCPFSVPYRRTGDAAQWWCSL